MPFSTLFESAYLVQMTVLALSIFNLVAFLWLACTVWLNGDRRSRIVYVGVTGLALSALFFFLHAVLIYHPFSPIWGVITPDVLWRLIWLPAVGVPYIWFVIGLHYAALINTNWYRRRPQLLISSGVLGCCVLVLLLLNQGTFSFVNILSLLAYRNTLKGSDPGFFSPFVLIPMLFLPYVAFCVVGPWFTPARVIRVVRVLWRAMWMDRRQIAVQTLRERLVDAFWEDQVRVEELEEPVLSWHLARPGLLLAALLMLGLIVSLGVLGVGSMLNWIELRQGTAPPPPLTMVPFSLLLLDMFVTGSVACITLLIGYSVVRHGILIERPLARRGFFEQWRGVVITATAMAIFIALLVMLTHSTLVGLLLITSLATGIYALFTWSSYTAHDRYIALLRPFMRRTSLRHWLNTDLQKTEQSMEDLFFHLCHDVLGVRCARLAVLTGSMRRRNFTYRWPETDTWDHAHKEESRLRLTQRDGDAEAMQRVPVRVHMTLHAQAMLCWVLPIYDELGPVATLYLGPREDGSVFTDEDMELAQACGQRILDTLRDHEAMQAVAGLLRRRIVDVKLLGAQHRRVLHDEILPQMHLALLRLEALRSSDAQTLAQNGSASVVAPDRQTETLNEVVAIISDAHRRLAAMMRATTPSAPHRLERDGMMHAIHTMIKQDFQQAFDEVEWQVSEETARHIDDSVPPVLAELIFAAVQEVLRNAARHARGSNIHRPLRLTLRASCDPHLEVIVADDGIGLVSASTTGSSTSGTGGGLLTHSALLAVAGGSLSVKSMPGAGVTVRIVLPAEALR